MNKIGRRIYYDISTGNVILDKGESMGSVKETTNEDDIRVFKVLAERNPSTFNFLNFEYGAFAQDFSSANSYHVNPVTKKVEFIYADPNEPDIELPYQPPLSEKVDSLEDENLQNMMAMIEMYENNLRLEEENASTMMAVAELYEMMLGGS